MNLKRFGAARAARATEQELRDYLASFGFRGDRVFEPIAPFSGGEKARLVLALVAYLRPNLMLLDEPTNHLDLEMRQALTLALQEYEGAVVLVSHDRHLLRTVADELYVVHAGRAEPFEGDLDDYARWLAETASSASSAASRQGAGSEAGAASVDSSKARRARADSSGSKVVRASDESAGARSKATQSPSEAALGAHGETKPGAAAPPASPPERSETAEERKQRKREEAERRNRLTPLRAAVEKCEKELERLTRLQAELHAQLESPDLYTESAKDRLRQLTEQQGRLARELEQVEAQWLEHSERLEIETRRV